MRLILKRTWGSWSACDNSETFDDRSTKRACTDFDDCNCRSNSGSSEVIRSCIRVYLSVGMYLKNKCIQLRTFVFWTPASSSSTHDVTSEDVNVFVVTSDTLVRISVEISFGMVLRGRWSGTGNAMAFHCVWCSRPHLVRDNELAAVELRRRHVPLPISITSGARQVHKNMESNIRRTSSKKMNLLIYKMCKEDIKNMLILHMVRESEYHFAESSTAFLKAPSSAVNCIFSFPPVDSRYLGLVN